MDSLADTSYTSLCNSMDPTNSNKFEALPSALQKSNTTLNSPADSKIITPECLSDNYKFLDIIGQGSQAYVYKARRLKDDSLVAIKQLRINSIANWKEYDLFQREARVLASLDIKGVAKCYEVVEDLTSDSPAAYIVQQFIHGRSLAEMIKSNYHFTLNNTFDLANQLLDILDELHHHTPTIIHRDIKPSNIILQPSDKDNYHLFLIDFGAVSNPQVQQGGSTVAGTYGYMPPEQLVGNPVPATDFYAMGAMLTYLLSGVEPSNMDIVDFRLVIDPHLTSYPRALVSLLHQMLDPNIENRLCDYNKLRTAFTNFKNNRFPFDETTPYDPKSIDESLKNVRKFNQPGNVNIWMMLPEVRPREVPPNYYKRILNLPKTHHQQRVVSFIDAVKSSLFAALIGSCPVLFILLLTFITNFNYISVVNILFITLGLGVFIFLFSLYITFIVPILKLLGSFSSILPVSHRLINGPYKLASILLTNGRKTIATVVSCKYIPTNGVTDCYKTIEHTDYQQCAIYNESPCFTVSYRFNPPDDSETDDIVHTIRVHKDVFKDLDVGDPLPILFLTSPSNCEVVISMPYPLPNDLDFCISDIIGCSKCGRIIDSVDYDTLELSYSNYII